MKIVGLITEYNPFHNGHLYHIKKAKEVTKADAVIVVMSGNFVQRGAPAIMPKHLRTRCALLAGASMVFELPVCYATASAELFAAGAVSLLDKLGIVDTLCFGSECGDVRILEEIADILIEEPEAYRNALKESLRLGLSFPLARQKALSKYSRILSEPNNILGIEYLKALKKSNSSIKAYTISRAGAGYHDAAINATLCSATAIRNQFQKKAHIDRIPELKKQIPKDCLSLMLETYGRHFPVQANDFSLLLRTRLLSETPESLVSYADVSEELANRISNCRNEYENLEQFCLRLKTKELTHSRISRSLFHILLNITKKEMEFYQTSGSIFYGRVLGFLEKDAQLFTQIKQRSQIPLITKPSRCDHLTAPGKSMLGRDLYAGDLYESVAADKFETPFINEKSRQLIKL